MDQSEQALIKEAQRGNIVAFESLVKRYDKQVMQLAYNMVNNTNDAEDIYQEVFVRVYKKLHHFHFRSEFSTWLYRVVVNYCINFRKKKGRAKFYPLEGDAVENENHGKVTFKGQDMNPEESVLNQELSDQITAALDKLSLKQKSVFVLRHYHGHKLQDIAKIMNCSEGTVKNYLFRATQKMQRLLKEYAKI
jgi:RNA polymerase sigma-70 factor (ECF subfamily)